MTRYASFAVVVAVAATVVLAHEPAEDTPAFSGQADLVTVDVVVANAGRPVAGLGREDFVLTEDGQPRAVDTFEAVDVPDLAVARAPLAAPRVSSNVGERARQGRAFLLAFDDLNLSPADGELAKQALLSFVEKIHDGDWIGVVATSGKAWWSTRARAEASELHALLNALAGLKAPRGAGMDFDQMTDYEAMRIAIHNDRQALDRVAVRWDAYGARATGEGIDHPDADSTRRNVRQRALEVFRAARQRTQATLSLLQRAAESLALGKGRKSILLLSDGFVYDSEIRGFSDLTEAARRGNVTFYCVDVRGLRSNAGPFDATTVGAVPDITLANTAADLNADEDGSNALASDTGGFTVRNTNDLASGLDRIARESQTYYLLGFKPGAKDDGHFHKIQVKVARAGVTVSARKGYYAGRKAAAALAAKSGEPDAAVRQALDSPFLADQIPLRISAYVFEPADAGTTKTLVVAEVDVASLPLEEKQGRFAGQLEISLATTLRENGHHDLTDEELDVSFSRDERAALRTGWYPIARMLTLAPGDYETKLVVREARSRRVGSVAHSFEVPPSGAWRVSTPNLTDVVHKEGPTPVPIPLARRAFAAGETLYCKFEVYGAALDPASGKPRVSASYDVRGADGRPTSAQSELVPIKPSAQGRVARTVGFSLAGWAPGDYDLTLEVADEVSGTRRELHEPFEVVAQD